ncbi:hypothetical protein PG985_015732 [Apiospora marii]|uniref:uncharacterized protein n=1 Tax=Apiospora marii TaxID=335849 RepID=UPI00312EFA2B
MASLTVGDLIPQLANLPFYAPNPRALQLGGQNFTHCCLRAVNDSLTVSSNNSLAFTNSSFFLPGTSAASLQAATDNGQFPCGAEWNGDAEGAPVVQVPYAWCTAQCPGWEISHVSKLSQWIGPLVQFILPSLAFCLNVPRARKLAVPDLVFRARPHDVLGFATYWLRLLGAMLLMTLDTTVWLSICFAFAGPMLMSAMYEFVLDRKVLEFLRPPAGSGRGDGHGKPLVPAKVRAQLLLAVVVGNVRISTTGFVERRRGSYATATSVVSETEAAYVDSSGGMGSVEVDAEAVGSPQQQQLVDDIWDRVMVMIDEYEELQEKGGLQVGVVSLATKLKALLNSQASFGSTIGAPVLFFVGGFIYTVIDIQNSLGDNDSAHALAFGMWWMTIPYLATVSCAMLASNSSSVLQGIVYDGGGSRAGPARPAPGFWGDIKTRLKKRSLVRRMLHSLNGYELIEHTYEGRFQTVTLWNRGLNKRRWVNEAIKDYAKEHAVTTAPSPLPPIASISQPGEEQGGAFSNESCRPSSANAITPDELRLGLRLRFGDLWNVFWGTAFLLLVPSALAFLTSYNTPRKVLSCRTITYLLYASSQVCAVGLWAWEARLKVRYGARWSETPTREKALNWWSQALVGFVGVFAAVGGTLMQLLGPYRACGCRIAASQWLRPSDPDALVVLSTNTKDSIRAAQEWWTVTGTASVILLGVVCALAWWHQRRLRKLFREEAESLETGWVPTTTLVVASGGSVPGMTVAGVVAEQPECSPSDLTSPKKELG